MLAPNADPDAALNLDVGGFGVYIEHVRHYGDEPDYVRLHVPALGTAQNYDVGDEAAWHDRLREAVKAAAVALGIL